MFSRKGSAWVGAVSSIVMVASGVAVAAPVSAAEPAQPRAVVSPMALSANPACQPNTYVSGGYTYVSFDDTGTCDWAVPYGVTSVDYLVVAGGGGGGVGRGGGGGAGGMLDDTGYDVSSTGVLTITVGAGGAGGTGNGKGSNGTNSSIQGATNVTAIGGGGGGAWDGAGVGGQGSPGNSGGSGGGGSGTYFSDANWDDTNIGGAGISGQGFAGGASSPQIPASFNPRGCAINNATGSEDEQYCAGGGGGGAGGAGLPGYDDTIGGDGGAGRFIVWIDDTVARNLQIGDDSGGIPYFAGGGGAGAFQLATCNPACGAAGAGGAGGGGAGGIINVDPPGTAVAAAAGVAATGGGGGGNEGATGPGGAGGSGVVVLRYLSSAIPSCSPADDTTTVAGQTILSFTGVGQCRWTPPTGVGTIWYLLVGGGGGGGAAAGGGGGGGALRDDSNVSIGGDIDGLLLTVGAGGLPGSVDVTGGQGGSSALEIGSTTYTAPGGSGGGSGPTSGLSRPGGAGGSGGDATATGGTGGGGATAAPGAASVGSSGPASDISGATLNYAGGGGGGPSATTATVQPARAGGSRGGGAGATGNNTTSNPGQPGVDGLGGGGGGGQTGGPNQGAGGRGGSGLVIIRYATPIQTQLSVATSAAGAVYGAAFTTQPAVSIDDSVGSRVTTDDTTVVTARLLNGASVVLQEDTATAVNGLATFANLGFSSAVLAGDDTIVFTASGLSSIDDTVTVAKATPTPAAWAGIAKTEGDPAFTITPPAMVGVYGNSNVSGTWSYASDDTAVADISGSTVTVGVQGTANITGTWTPAGTSPSSSYNGTTATTTVTVSAVVPPTPPATRVPGPPRDVTATAGDRSITVSWQPPTDPGSFAVSSYEVRAAPGGATCLVSAPTLTCTISGLTNGTAYTVEVKALNGAGWGPWSDSAGPITPTPNPKPPTPSPVPVPPLGPGDSDLEVDRTPKPVEVDPNAWDNGLDVSGDSWTMTLEALDGDKKPLNLGPKGVLIVDAERDVRTTGTSFKPGSFVTLYVDPPTQVTGTAARVAETIELGTLAVGSDGTFAGSKTLPDGIAPGDHVLQAIGYGPGGEERALSIGIVVQAWIVLDQGTRVKNGRHDRIRSGGTTGGIDEGSRLMPYIRYSSQKTFSGGKAQIKVQADGSYTWTRKIRKDRGLAAYIAYEDVESNKVYWAKIR